MCDFLVSMKLDANKVLFDSTNRLKINLELLIPLRFQQELIEHAKQVGCSRLMDDPSNLAKTCKGNQKLSQLSDIQRFMAWYTLESAADAKVLETFFMFRNFNYRFTFNIRPLPQILAQTFMIFINFKI